MSDYTPKLQKVAAAVLEPGETLVAGCRAMSKGATAGIVGGAAGAVAGGAAGAVLGGRAGEADRSAAEEQAGAAGIGKLPPQVALGLTDRRLLVFSRGGLSGKAKDLVAEIPRSEIASIEGEDSGSKLKPDRLVVHLASGGHIEFEAVKADGYEGLTT